MDTYSYQTSRLIFSKYLHYTGSRRSDLEGIYPCILSRGEGCRVWDLDGNEYTDFTCATGSVTLGYAYPDIVETIKLRSGLGNLFITQFSEEMGILAEQLVNIIPSAEKVAFFRTGSCGTTAAVRLARVSTGRNIVLTSGYHGWHDWHLGIFPRFRLPDSRHIEFGYNLNLLQELLEDHEGNVAAVIITPEPAFFPDEYFLELADIVRSASALLIFDEVMSGFRYELGGVQVQYKIKPDLSIFGKGLANEYSLSAVVGRADIIEARNDTHLAGTFNQEIIPLVIASKTLELMTKNNVIRALQVRGTQLLTGMRSLFQSYGVVAELTDTPAIFHIIFEDEDFAQAFYMKCLSMGLLFHRFDQQMVSLSHSEETVNIALARVDEALNQLRQSFPSAFGNEGATITSAARDYRTLHEFGGLCDYRLPSDKVPRTWHQDNR